MPEGWKNVELGEILTDEQIAEVVRLAGSIADDLQFTRQVKDYLNTFSVELDAKGVVPNYLAYVLTAMLPTLRTEASRRLSAN